MRHRTASAKMPEWLAVGITLAALALAVGGYLFLRSSPQEKGEDSAAATKLKGSASIVPLFTHALSIGERRLAVAYAVTPAEQERGLSGTAALADDHGMLFILPEDAVAAFWMKDMSYPIDIIWIGADKRVAEISRDLDPASYPEAFSPKVPVRYVLEVPAGFARANGVVQGMQVSF